MLPAEVSVFEAPAVAHLAFTEQRMQQVIIKKRDCVRESLFCLDSAEGKTKLSQRFKAAEVKPHLPLWR